MNQSDQDGAYDPEHCTRQPYAYDRPQYLALDGAMSRFLDWCKADQASCAFGDGDPRGAFEKLSPRWPRPARR